MSEQNHKTIIEAYNIDKISKIEYLKYINSPEFEETIINNNFVIDLFKTLNLQVQHEQENR